MKNLIMILFKKLIKKISSRQMKQIIDFQEYAYSQSKHKQTSKSHIIVNNQEHGSSNTYKLSKSKKNPVVIDRIKVLNKILQWRKNNEAPVDTMGCERLADPKAPADIQKYQILVSLMLSIQTKDETTSMIVNRLKQLGLTPQITSKRSEQQLRQLIYQSNFNKRKAANLIQVSRIIQRDGRIANTKQQLLKYPGVGVKIAMIYLKVAEGKEGEGIGVDTHVHRISNRLGWVKSDNPQQTQNQLQQVFPVKIWKDINIALVGFGQLRCNAKKPLCKGCPVEQNCPSSKINW